MAKKLMGEINGKQKWREQFPDIRVSFRSFFVW